MTNASLYLENIENLARGFGLDYFPVRFQSVPPSFMTEVAVYGLPVRMPHWSFGVRYIYQLIQHRMGHSHIFEVVVPGDPGQAFLADTNNEAENTLVLAHVLGHADFSKNNMLFRRTQEQVGYHIVEQAAAHAYQINQAIERHGQARVERVLDAALSLEQHIDTHRDLRRAPYPAAEDRVEPAHPDPFRERLARLSPLEAEENGSGDQSKTAQAVGRKSVPVPPHPEADLLWFIAHYAPDMEPWERDIFLAVRQESFYFQPIFSCQIMNEGWASYWHARLLREASFLPQDLYLEAIKTHSDVVRPYAADEQVALAINPYHLGFVLWDRLIEEGGIEAARRVMIEEDDAGFIRNYLDQELAKELKLFQYRQRRNGEITAADMDLDAIKEDLLRAKYNFGAPHIVVEAIRRDGCLILRHEHNMDGRGLDPDAAHHVLGYIQQVWRRGVRLQTVNKRGQEEWLSVEDAT